VRAEALFVGRHDELAVIESTFEADRWPHQILFISGPRGIGKTTLLTHCRELARAHAIPFHLITAASHDPATPALRDELRALLRTTKRTVVLLDDYDRLQPLQNWLEDDWIPRLPACILLITASLHRYTKQFDSAAWWLPLVRPMPLDPLTRAESQKVLRNLRVPESAHAAIVAFAGGHPAALARIASLLRSHGGKRFDPTDHLEFQRALTAEALEEVAEDLVPAVEALAVAGGLTPALLSELLDVTNSDVVYQRLANLAFVRPIPSGIDCIGAVRNAIALEVAWRDRDRHQELVRRAFRFRARHMSISVGAAQSHVTAGLLRLLQNEPSVAPYLDWEHLAHGRFNAVVPEDFDVIVQSARAHEGEASADLIRRWADVMPTAFEVIRRGTRPTAWMMMMAVGEEVPSDWPDDPVVTAARDFFNDKPLRSGEQALLLRAWMAVDTYQSVSAGQTAILRETSRAVLRSPGCAALLVAARDAEAWAAPLRFFGSADPAIEASVGEHQCAVFGIDWRRWVASSWESTLAAPTRPLSSAPHELRARVITEDDFKAAVRVALKHFNDPDELRTSPLMECRVTLEVERRTHADREDALRTAIGDSAMALQNDPRTVRYYRAIRDFWLSPRGTQQAVAKELGVPFSTFRRHLSRGADLVARTLWKREVPHLRYAD